MQTYVTFIQVIRQQATRCLDIRSKMVQCSILYIGTPQRALSYIYNATEQSIFFMNDLFIYSIRIHDNIALSYHIKIWWLTFFMSKCIIIKKCKIHYI